MQHAQRGRHSGDHLNHAGHHDNSPGDDRYDPADRDRPGIDCYHRADPDDRDRPGDDCYDHGVAGDNKYVDSRRAARAYCLWDGNLSRPGDRR
jgi:hypothetical protein